MYTITTGPFEGTAVPSEQLNWGTNENGGEYAFWKPAYRAALLQTNPAFAGYTLGVATQILPDTRMPRRNEDGTLSSESYPTILALATANPPNREQAPWQISSLGTFDGPKALEATENNALSRLLELMGLPAYFSPTAPKVDVPVSDPMSDAFAQVGPFVGPISATPYLEPDEASAPEQTAETVATATEAAAAGQARIEPAAQEAPGQGTAEAETPTEASVPAHADAQPGEPADAAAPETAVEAQVPMPVVPIAATPPQPDQPAATAAPAAPAAKADRRKRAAERAAEAPSAADLQRIRRTACALGVELPETIATKEQLRAVMRQISAVGTPA
jgi:hypothetical protein